MKLVACFLLVSGLVPLISAEIVNFSYNVWIGDNVYQSNAKCVEVSRGTKIFDGMLQVAEQDPTSCDVTYETTKLGHYVTGIGSNFEDPENNKFWMLYELTSLPSCSSPPSDKFLTSVGVDKLVIKDGRYYLLWLKTVT